MTISGIPSNSPYLVSQRTGTKTASGNQSDAAALGVSTNSPVDRFTKSSPDTGEGKLYSPPANSGVQSLEDGAKYRLGAVYYDLSIIVPVVNGQVEDYNTDDHIKYISLNETRFGDLSVPDHPDQDKYDKFNEFFKQTYIDVLTERGLMPESGDIKLGCNTDVPVKTSEIYDVVNEVTRRVQNDKWASNMMAELHLDEYPIATRPNPATGGYDF